MIGISQSGPRPTSSPCRRGRASGRADAGDHERPVLAAGARRRALVELQPARSARRGDQDLHGLARPAAALARSAAPRAADRAAALPEALARQLALTGEVDECPSGRRWERLTVVGRGANYGTAFEAALKVWELARRPGRGLLPADLLTARSAIRRRGFPCSWSCRRARRAGARGARRPGASATARRSRRHADEARGGCGSSACRSGSARSWQSSRASCWRRRGRAPWCSTSTSQAGLHKITRTT